MNFVNFQIYYLPMTLNERYKTFLQIKKYRGILSLPVHLTSEVYGKAW